MDNNTLLDNILNNELLSCQFCPRSVQEDSESFFRLHRNVLYHKFELLYESYSQHFHPQKCTNHEGLGGEHQSLQDNTPMKARPVHDALMDV